MHVLGQSVFLKALGWSLFNSLWQMALLWIVYILLTGAGKRFTAGVRHVTATVLLGSGFVWFAGSFLSLVVNRTAASVSPAELSPWVLPDSSSLYLFFNNARQLLGNLLPYCSIAYMAVLVFLFGRYLQHYLHSRKLKLEGLHKASPALRIFVDQVVQQLSIHKKVSVWLSTIADCPLTVGFFKSVILIPLATVNHLTTDQVEAILLHELAHIKRNDYFLNLLVAVTGILFFFNPFSRLLIRHLRKETENSCDDLVMQFRYDPRTYVSALLSLERTRHQQQLVMAAVGKSNQMLLERVRRITGHKNKFRYNIAQLIILFLLTFLTGIGAWIRAGKSIKPLAVPHPNYARVVSAELPSAYRYTGIKEPKKMGVTLKRKSKTTKHVEVKDDVNDLVLVSNDEPSGSDADETANFTPAVQPEADRDYSITQSHPKTQPEVKIAGDQYPFVPSSSFSFKIIEDTATREKFTYDERMARESLQKALKALDALNWEKIGSEIDRNGKRINAAKLKAQLRKSLSQLDWQKINDDATPSVGEADEQRMKEDLQLQIHALKTNKNRPLQETQKLERQIIQGQERLYQDNLKKLNESLKEIELIRKRNKIVYI